MCLDNVEKIITDPQPTTCRAFKLFNIVYPYDVGFKFYSINPTVRSSTSIPCDRWLKAHHLNVAFYEYGHTVPYTSGFHCYTTRAQADLARPSSYGRSVIVPVLTAYTRVIGKQGHRDTIVCDRMRISRIVLRKALIKWANGLLSKELRVPHTFKSLGLPLTVHNSYAFYSGNIAERFSFGMAVYVTGLQRLLDEQPITLRKV